MTDIIKMLIVHFIWTGWLANVPSYSTAAMHNFVAMCNA